MERTLIAALVLWCVWPAEGQSAPATAPARPTQADRLASRSLRRDAINMTLLPGARDRRFRSRMWALCLLAKELAPDDAEANDLLARICRVYHPAKARQEAESLKLRLAARPGDYFLAMEWLRLKLSTLGTAEGRIALLDGLAGDEAFSKPLRAEAAAYCGLTLRATGKAAEAEKRFAQALAMDPHNPTAVAYRDSRDQPAAGPAAAVKRMLQLLRCNMVEPAGPDRLGTAGELAVLLDSMGLGAESLMFFDFSWRMARRRRNSRPAAQLVIPYFNAMLNAGRFRQAVALFESFTTEFAESVDFRSLLAEAYRAIGETKKADKQIDAIAMLYRPKEADPALSTRSAVELAMFYLVTRPQPRQALARAYQAQRSGGATAPERRLVQRVLGAAEIAYLQKNLAPAGEKHLKELLGKDLYAGLFLAEHYYRTGKTDQGNKTLLAAVPQVRSGPAYRRLAGLARRKKVQLSPAKHAAAVRKLLRSFDQGVLTVNLAPAKHVAVTIEPVTAAVRTGEAIWIAAVLSNPGRTPVGLGSRGLLSPRMALRVKIGDETFTLLPPVVWAAPRYLQPGQVIIEKVRIDVGPLGRFMALRPLDELSLTVEGVLDPIGQGASSLPSVVVTPAAVKRMDLLGRFDRARPSAWPKAYETALGRIVHDIKRGDLPTRMLAARQVGALVAMVQDIEKGRSQPPAPLAGKISKAVILRMMVEVLADAADVVRSEMLAAMLEADIDSSVVRHIGPPIIQDRSPLVRLRLVQLLGQAGMTAPRSVVAVLARDPSKPVRLMAAGFGGNE